MIRFLYPYGKKKAVTFSYDDNQIYDRRLVDIFNKYGLKATFHLNSGTLDQPANEVDQFITSAEVKTLYEGHEVACHGVNHPFFDHLEQTELVREIWEDKKRLEQLTGKLVRGMSYPFGNFNEHIMETAKALGIEYSRTVENTKDFRIPADPLAWHPTCHHNDLTEEFIDHFIHIWPFMKNSLLYVWGHSFEFERENTWDIFEARCKLLAGHDEIWYATNIEIKDYLDAVKAMKVSADGTIVHNPSAIDVYLLTEKEECVCVKSGKTIVL